MANEADLKVLRSTVEHFERNPVERKTEYVTERALFERIKRRLARDYVFFHRTRATDLETRRTCGAYHSVDERNHACNPAGDDLEAIGRDVGVLQPWEKLIPDRGR